MTTPPPGSLPPDRLPHDVHRGGLWLRFHRSDGDCILQVEAHGYSMERLRLIITSEPTLVVAFYDGTTGVAAPSRGGPPEPAWSDRAVEPESSVTVPHLHVRGSPRWEASVRSDER
jgi:hypothetical protein